jgi:poly(3-hydroxybutyrate) depolymerase
MHIAEEDTQGGCVLYQSFQVMTDASLPGRTLAGILNDACHAAWRGDPLYPVSKLAALMELVSLVGLTHERPAFGIGMIESGGTCYEVTEEVILKRPFGSLLRFRKRGAPAQPRVMVVAPLSGHFATLLRATVKTMLADHDVYITDWHNPRDVPLAAGRFGFDEYVLQLVEFLGALGPGAHLLAVCQPTVAALAAVSLMAQEGNAAQPVSLTLMAGPIDARQNPTKVNELASGKPMEYFENLCSRVPLRFAGGSRRVYPGFVQLCAFMSMNLERHLDAFAGIYKARLRGDRAKAEATRTFYEEYFATMDLPAEFYLETVKKVFQDCDLARGELVVRGRKVEPKAIRRMALLTVEGERDDICSVGQTLAAQDLCSGVRPYLKRHHVQTGVGHYGVFSGKRWETGVYPQVRDVIQMAEQTLRAA